MQNYDVVVLGGGPGGYVAAIRAASSGFNTALIEKDMLGGVCLNWGCIPTKSLLRNAEIIKLLNQSEMFGFELSDLKIKYAKAHERSRKVSAKLVKGIEYLMKKNKITVFKDTGRLVDPTKIILDQSGQLLTTKYIIIATGASPAKLSLLDYGMPGVIDSKKALQLESVPKSVSIVGAGAIGMEFATIFSSYGTKVSVIEVEESVLPHEDKDISDFIQKQYEDMGVQFFTETNICSVKETDNLLCIELQRKGETSYIETEFILSATGILPNTSNIGISACGVELDDRGYIVTEESMRTNQPNIYAIGDVTGKLTLAHVASAQALTAVEHICTGKVNPICYQNIPKCTYTEPEVASVGLTEQVARERGFLAESVVFPFSANGKAVSYGDDRGFAKLVYDKEHGQLLGVHMVGVHVTEMIWGIAGYLGMEMTIGEMKEIIHPHPSVSEVISEVAHLAYGEPIHI